MRKIALIASLWLTGSALAFAHPATEQFIPIGQSPGAGVVRGEAASVVEPAGAGGETVLSIIGESAGSMPFVIGPNTRIYVDRSAQRLPNLVGTVADLVPGRTVEARLADSETRVAEWVKVRP